MNKIIRVSNKKNLTHANVIGFACVISMIIISFFLRNYPEVTFLLSGLTLFIYSIFLAYHVRYYPQTLILSGDSISIDYLSKSFFRQKPFMDKCHNISLKEIDGKITLYQKGKIIAIINDGSISKNDEEELRKIFSLQITP